MININGTYFDTSVKEILELIRKETNGEFIKQLKYSSVNEND